MALAAGAASIAGAATPDPNDSRTMLLAVRINGNPVDDAWQLVRAADGYHATAEAFAAWRLRLPPGEPVKMQNRMVYPLRPPVRTTFDPATQTLAIDAPAAAFVSTTLDAAPAVTAYTPSPPGAFLNYDVQATRNQSANGLGGAVEVGVFGKLGVVTTTALARAASGKPEIVRLQTVFSRDDPVRATTLRVGDSVGAASAWGRRVYFGGVQWGSNFSTRPDMVLLPLPSLHGEAVQPSVVDLYVNNVLTTRREVAPGPFTVNQVPIVTGAGEVRMVVRDVLGREQVVNLDYYLSPELLRRGLHEFSWEGGARRENLGIASNDYGPWFASTTHRYGVSDRLTMDGRAEVQEGLAAVGAGVVYRVASLGTIAGGVAGSASRPGAGGRGYAQFQHLTRRWSLSGRVEGATHGFRQVGMAEGELPPAFGAQVFASVSLPSRQTISAGYVRTNHRGDRPDINLGTLGYSVQLASGVSATLTAFRPFAGDSTWGAGVTLSYSLDARRFLSGGVSRNDGHTIGTLQLQQGLPTDTGFGYDVRAQAGETNAFGARLLYQNDYGNYGVEASGWGRQLNFLAGASGGIVTMGGHTMLARRVQDSFALVEVPGSPGVDIYSNNQRVATTNRSGVGLVPNLLPYQRNTVRIDDRGLPVEMELDLGERTVVPHARSGVLVTFAAKRNSGATLRIVTDDNEWMPLGSEVRSGDTATAYHVARRGEVFLPEISYPATVRVVHRGRACSFTVTQPESRDALPRLGPFKCRSTSMRASL